MINRHRLLVATATALAVVPTAATSAPRWLVSACSVLAVFLSTLANPARVRRAKGEP